ncbi:hypothetical protein L0B53_05570 [Vibrio sp. SS-MA-C1-2]|uniref:multiheme c-type cytochrome n=1 Tax=Vibrio sp. SS-MA-C1-2 TaxID=2908646 RepID=UPI001F476700|nr:multiheme c-type cytochrome [Vibrio sp. SS-MA-C1-2]UJF19057.1 hypothetical protein L0B53_05570 [Vibrio sp. SS-MA-C1-2]
MIIINNELKKPIYLILFLIFSFFSLPSFADNSNTQPQETIINNNSTTSTSPETNRIETQEHDSKITEKQQAKTQSTEEKQKGTALNIANKSVAKCVRCHKKSGGGKLEGNHKDAFQLTTKKGVNCIDCHTKPTKISTHRRSSPNVIKFNQQQLKDQAKGSAASDEKLSQIFKQNDRCIHCHEPLQLQKTNWTHDVHGNNLTCSSCHKIHPKDDPVIQLNKKGKIASCKACHLKN